MELRVAVDRDASDDQRDAGPFEGRGQLRQHQHTECGKDDWSQKFDRADRAAAQCSAALRG
jgi:hypothetical protein